MLAMTAVMSAGFTSCNWDDDEVIANPTSVSIDAAGGTQTIQVTSNTNWSVSGNPGWLTVAPTQGSKNGTFSVTANSTSESRSCVLYIQAGDALTPISVNQYKPIIDPLVGTWKHTYGEGYELITFYDNNRGVYSLYDLGEWDANNDSFTYTYSNNIITLRWDKDHDVETMRVESLTSTQLVLDWDDEVCTFYRQ